MAAAVREAGLGIILDIVPNHMATDPENRFWADRELRAKFFDLDEVTGRHRRFFDVDHLAALRQEDPEVFDATHALALRLVEALPSAADARLLGPAYTRLAPRPVYGRAPDAKTLAERGLA